MALYRATADTPYPAPNMTGRRANTDAVESYDWQIERIALPDGQYGVVCHFYDATRVREVEQALRASEEQFRRAIEDAPIPVIMHAEDGEVLRVSRSWTELTGYTIEDEHIVQSWLTKAYGAGGESVRAAMLRAFLPPTDGEQPMRAAVFDIVTRGGETRTWSFNASAPGTLRDGRRFVVGMAEDITERRRQTHALAQNEQRKAAVLESAIDCLITMDHDGRFVDFNAAAERTFGHKRGDVVGKTVADTIIPPRLRQAHREGLDRYLRTGEARVLGRPIGSKTSRSPSPTKFTERMQRKIMSPGKNPRHRGRRGSPRFVPRRPRWAPAACGDRCDLRRYRPDSGASEEPSGCLAGQPRRGVIVSACAITVIVMAVHPTWSCSPGGSRRRVDQRLGLVR